MEKELQRIGLSFEILHSLSYKSGIDMSMKKSLSHFDKGELMEDIRNCINYYHESSILDDIDADYRIKSMDSCIRKFDKYYPKREVERTFNDILGFRVLCDNYDVYLMPDLPDGIRIADMSKGKSNDD